MDTKQFEEAMDRVKEVTGCRTQVQLAEVLDVRQSSISDAKRRHSIPAAWLILLLAKYNVNPLWITNGAAEPKFRILSDEHGEAVNVEELREQVRAEIKAKMDNPRAEELIHRLEAMGLHVVVSSVEKAA